MNTPITDAVNMERYADHYEGYCAMLNNARRLELDRAALMEALEEITKMAERVDSWESFPSAPINKAYSALSAARANFPEQ